MSSSPNSIAQARILPRRWWISGRGIAAIACALLATLCTLAAILGAGLLVNLIEERGVLNIPVDDIDAFREFTARTRLEPPEQLDVSQFVNTGITPVVWRNRHHWWAPPLVAAWRNCTWLQSNFEALLAILLAMLVLLMVRILAISKSRTLAATAAMDTSMSLRRSIHRQAMRLGPSDLGAEQEVAVELFTTATESVRDGMTEWYGTIARVLTMAAGLLILALVVDWRLALQCLIPLLGIWAIVRYERSRGQAIRRRAEAEAELRPLAESLRKTRLVRGYAMEEFEHEHFTQHLTRFSRGILRGRLGETWALRSARLLTVCFLTVILLLLALRGLSVTAPLSLAPLFLISVCLIGLTVAAFKLPRLLELNNRLVTEADRIYRYLAQAPEVAQAVGAKFLNPVSQSIIFEAVSYSRNGQPLLNRCDLRIPAHSRTAIISPDRLTQKAIAYLLPRFIEPQAGRILFDSEDIAWATLESLRAETVYVGEDDPFFTGTVLENITCGRSDYTLQDAMEAAKQAHAHNFIAALPQGYETKLGEHGEQLSPGEAFRLGLARAILRNPAVLIIEEPHVTLDDDTKSFIDDTYKRIFPGRTVIVFPSRLSTIRSCDQVIFVQHGKTVAVGTHADLVRSSEPYRHWEYVNFSKLARDGAATA